MSLKFSSFPPGSKQSAINIPCSRVSEEISILKLLKLKVVVCLLLALLSLMTSLRPLRVKSLWKASSVKPPEP